MWVFQLLYHRYVIELDIEILIDRFQSSADLDIVLELDGDFVVDQGLEKAVCENRVLASMRVKDEGIMDCAYLKKSILRELRQTRKTCGCNKRELLALDEVVVGLTVSLAKNLNFKKQRRPSLTTRALFHHPRHDKFPQLTWTPTQPSRTGIFDVIGITQCLYSLGAVMA